MNQRFRFLTLLGAPLALLSMPAHAALHVFACEPEWGALAQQLGGSLVDVSVATNALQDPHQIQAKPSLIARTRNADLVVCTGAELEIGWLPVLLQQSGNAKVQPGQPGNFALVATALGTRLQQLDPAHAGEYAKALAAFSPRWQQAIARWTAQAAPLRGVPVVSQHKAFVYLYDWLGLKEVALLEPKPGVEPTASHLQEVLATLKSAPAKMVLYAAYQDPRPSEWLSKNAGIAAVKVPFTVGGTEGAKNLFGLFADTVARLLAAGAKP